MTQWELFYTHPEDKEACVEIHDDGKVAYAYFRRADKIVGYVWLYNRVPFYLRERGDPPLNPEAQVDPEHFHLPEKEADFSVAWIRHDNVLECGIYVRRRLLAVVGDGDRPGWCILAGKDSSLAQVMGPEEQ